MRGSDEESRDRIARLEQLSQVIFGIVFGYLLLKAAIDQDWIRWGSAVDALLYDQSRFVSDLIPSLIGTFVFAFAAVFLFILWWAKLRGRVLNCGNFRRSYSS